MKLYLYDHKHNRVDREFNMEGITAEGEALVKEIITFLNEQEVLRGYLRLQLAKSHTVTYEEGEAVLTFDTDE